MKGAVALSLIGLFAWAIAIPSFDTARLSNRPPIPSRVQVRETIDACIREAGEIDGHYLSNGHELAEVLGGEGWSFPARPYMLLTIE